MLYIGFHLILIPKFFNDFNTYIKSLAVGIRMYFS